MEVFHEISQDLRAVDEHASSSLHTHYLYTDTHASHIPNLKSDHKFYIIQSENFKLARGVVKYKHVWYDSRNVKQILDTLKQAMKSYIAME